MNKLQVCLSPALLHLYNVENTTIIMTDVLRASSTMVAALELGVKEIIPVASRNEARSFLDVQNTFVAGERNGKKVSDFHYGNSPLLLKSHAKTLQGNTLVMTTTNGTKAIQAAADAKTIYIGALTNVQSVANQLTNEQDEVLVLCAGWKNRVNLEDTLFAGALCDAVKNDFSIYGDAAIMSHQLFHAHKNHLFDSIKEATHYQRLKSHGIEDDIRYCMSLNTVDILPVLKEGRIVRQ